MIEHERRLHPRVPVAPLAIDVALHAATPLAEVLHGRLLDLSAGGCCLEVAQPARTLQVGTECLVLLPVSAQGVYYQATVLARTPASRKEAPGAPVLLRLHFHTMSALAQRLFTSWLNQVVLQAWRHEHGASAGAAA